jgi:hypothetical protein
MAQLAGLDEIAQHITAALGDRPGTDHIAQRLAAALAGEDVVYLDLSGLQVSGVGVDVDGVAGTEALGGTLVAVTATRFLVEHIQADDGASTVETRSRNALTGIDYAGPDAHWAEATDELPLPEGCYLTLHFAGSSSLQVPAEPANAVSSAQRVLSELLPELREDLGR